jgi:sterol desaturase/sphingolipid hydroxylase (fatty acid hydroxylase superfamily)
MASGQRCSGAFEFIMTPDAVREIRALIFWGGFFLFLACELIRPYRPPSVSKAKRIITNISLTIINSVILNALFFAATLTTITYVSEHKTGIMNMIDMPSWPRTVLIILFLDFMLYIWHLLNHVMPLLWRFHRVHHSDLNMDVSTASRFHIGELSMSALIKIGLIYFIGADILSVVIFESLLVFAAQFQHSSLRVPDRFEKVFRMIFVPPSMHRIHHSVKIFQRDSNYGTILSIWDRLLGTMITDAKQEDIAIGLAQYRDFVNLKIHHLLVMPFTKLTR